MTQINPPILTQSPKMFDRSAKSGYGREVMTMTLSNAIAAFDALLWIAEWRLDIILSLRGYGNDGSSLSDALREAAQHSLAFAKEVAGGVR